MIPTIDTYKIIERLIDTIDDTEEIITWIKHVIIRDYFQNADDLSEEQVIALYELEQSKIFFVYLEKEFSPLPKKCTNPFAGGKDSLMACKNINGCEECRQ